MEEVEAEAVESRSPFGKGLHPAEVVEAITAEEEEAMIMPRKVSTLSPNCINNQSFMKVKNLIAQSPPTVEEKPQSLSKTNTPVIPVDELDCPPPTREAGSVHESLNAD